MKALVVDDDAFSREINCLYLRRLDYEVEQAEDGDEALAMLRDTSYDVVLLDLRMGTLSGQGVLRLKRFFAGDDSAQYIVLTGDAEVAEVEGSDAVLHKPLQREELKAVLQRLTERKP